MAWVRFSELNLMYYNEDFIYAIASNIGKPIKTNVNTTFATRGRFARVCVEVDLTKPLVAQFWLDKCWHSIEYDGFHVICFACGRYGHLANKCPKNQTSVTKTTNEQHSNNPNVNQPSSNITAGPMKPLV